MIWWRTLLMVSLFKAQLVIDWNQTTTWRTTHSYEMGSLSNDTHSYKTQTTAPVVPLYETVDSVAV